MGLGATLSFEQGEAVNAMVEAAKKFQSLGEHAEHSGEKVHKVSGVLEEMKEHLEHLEERSLFEAFEKMEGKLEGLTKYFEKGIHMAMEESEALQLMEHALAAAGGSAEKTEEQFKVLARAAAETSAATGVSEADILEGERAFLKLGGTGEEAAANIDTVTRAASNAGVSVKEMVETLTGATRAMGLDLDKTSEVADLFTVATKNGRVAAGELGMVLERTGKTIRAMGVDSREAVQTMALLGKSMGGRQAVSGFEELVKGLKKIRDATRGPNKEKITLSNVANLNLSEEAKKELGEAGLGAFTALQKAAEDGSADKLAKQFDNFAGATKRSNESHLDNAIGQLKLLGQATEEFHDALFTGFAEEFKPIFKEVKDFLVGVTFVLNDLFEAGEEGWDREDELTEKYGKTVVAVGKGIKRGMDILKEGFDFVVDKIHKVTGAVEALDGDFTSKVAKWAIILAGVGAGVAPVLGGLAFVGWSLTSIQGLVTGVIGMFQKGWVVVNAGLAITSGLLTTISGMFSVLAGVGTGVMLPVLAVVVAIGAAAYLIYAYWDDIAEMGRFAWEEIKEGAEMFWEMLKPFFDWVEVAWRGVSEWASEAWDEVASVVGDAWEDFKRLWVDPVDAALGGISDTFANIFADVGALARGAWDFIDNLLFKPIGDQIKMISEFWGRMWGALTSSARENMEKRRDEGVQADIDAKREALHKKRLSDLAEAATKKEGEKATPVVENHIKNDVHSKVDVNLDGKTVAKAVAKSQQETLRRASKTSMWQPERLALEHGARPVPNG